MLVIGGLNSIRTAFNTAFTHLACGSGTTAETEADSALGTEILRLAKTSSDSSVDKKVDMEFIMSSATGNGSSFTEVGLYTAVSAGTMGSRNIITSITKNSTFEIDFVVTLTVNNG